MKLVIIESPYSGDIERNVEYACMCVKDSLLRDEAPFASHLLYTQPSILNDEIEIQRWMGMRAGWEWMRKANLVAVYMDLGISKGMEFGIAKAEFYGVPVEYRKLKPIVV